MAVREFNGTTDQLICGIGAASGMTFGTAAAIIKFADVTDFRAIGHLHDSGGTFVANPVGTNTAPAWEMHNGASSSNPALAAVSIGVWYLVVVRKATGTVAPRFSVYNYTAATWAHAAGGTALANWTAPGVGGNVQFSFQANAGDVLNGRVAARAFWSNSLPWTADAAGDTAIQNSGLKDAAANWASNNPTAFWLFNQASTATAVVDLSTAGTANQTSITGTTVVTTDDPAGFSFALGSAPTNVARPVRWVPWGPQPTPLQQLGDSSAPPVITRAQGGITTAAATTNSIRLIPPDPYQAGLQIAGMFLQPDAFQLAGDSSPSAVVTRAESGLAVAAGASQAVAVKVAKQGGVCAATATSAATRSAARTGLTTAAAMSAVTVVKVAKQSGTCSTAGTGAGTGRKAAAGAGVSSACVTANPTAAKKAAATATSTAAATVQARAAKKTPATAVTSAAAAAASTCRKVAPGTGSAFAAGFTSRSMVVAPRAVSATCSMATFNSGRGTKISTTSGAAGTAASVRGNGVKRATPSAVVTTAGTCQGTPRKKAPVTAATANVAQSLAGAHRTAVCRGSSYAASTCEGRRRALSRWTYRPDTGTTPRPDTGITPRPAIYT